MGMQGKKEDSSAVLWQACSICTLWTYVYFNNWMSDGRLWSSIQFAKVADPHGQTAGLAELHQFSNAFLPLFSSCTMLLSCKRKAWARCHHNELGEERLPQGQCLTTGKSPNFSVTPFSIYKRGIIIVLGFTGVKWGELVCSVSKLFRE